MVCFPSALRSHWNALCACTALALSVTPLYGVIVTSDIVAHETTPGVAVNGINHDGIGKLIVSDTTYGKGIQAGGSLLWTGRHILTAAHCVVNENGNFWTGPGTFSFDTPTGTLSYTVKSSVYHPLYIDEGQIGYDIAILTLEETVDASIPRYDIFTGNPIGMDFTFFGYGYTGTGDTGRTTHDQIKRWG